MAMASSPLVFPSTPPSKLRTGAASSWYLARPATSSPLAKPLPSSSSPIAEAQARRRSQYKSHAPSTPVSGSKHHRRSNCENNNINTILSVSASGSRKTDPSGSSARYRTPASLAIAANNGETPQVSFLRQRFKSKCVERAKRARQEDRERRRWASASSVFSSSDGADVDMEMDDQPSLGYHHGVQMHAQRQGADEDEDDDDAVLNDEFFRRVVANERRKAQHAYRLSYELDVGSSFDPDMMDVGEWEAELRQPRDEDELAPPEDLLDTVNDDELAALYEELEREQQQQRQHHDHQPQQDDEDDQLWEAFPDDQFDDQAFFDAIPDQMES